MEAYKIKIRGGRKLKNHTLKFLSRIDNDGSSLIPITEPIEFNTPTKYKVHCLSITHKKWIASDGMSTYIVEIIENETKKKIPYFKPQLIQDEIE